jgi:MFS family permease
LTAFFLPYAAVEVPSNILLKKIGPKYYLPLLVFAFGLITTCTCVVRNFGDLVAIRVFLGIAEGGMMVNPFSTQDIYCSPELHIPCLASIVVGNFSFVSGFSSLELVYQVPLVVSSHLV